MENGDFTSEKIGIYIIYYGERLYGYTYIYITILHKLYMYIIYLVYTVCIYIYMYISMMVWRVTHILMSVYYINYT